jgi:hypothetical protein
LYWQTSIVDLMKLLGIDPSLSNLQQLAQELDYKGDTSDSTTLNVWLHGAVMRKWTQGGDTVSLDLPVQRVTADPKMRGDHCHQAPDF